jgi:hypothetical protein
MEETGSIKDAHIGRYRFWGSVNSQGLKWFQERCDNHQSPEELTEPVLERINRRKIKFLRCGAGVAEHGQSRTKRIKGLDARDSRSRLSGVREFKSHPLHQVIKKKYIRIGII